MPARSDRRSPMLEGVRGFEEVRKILMQRAFRPAGRPAARAAARAVRFNQNLMLGLNTNDHSSASLSARLPVYLRLFS
jgi:hypothetical protein